VLFTVIMRQKFICANYWDNCGTELAGVIYGNKWAIELTGIDTGINLAENYLC